VLVYLNIYNRHPWEPGVGIAASDTGHGGGRDVRCSRIYVAAVGCVPMSGRAFWQLITAITTIQGLLSLGGAAVITWIAANIASFSGGIDYLFLVGIFLLALAVLMLVVRLVFSRFVHPVLPAGTNVALTSDRKPALPPASRKRSFKDDETYARREHILLPEIADLEGISNKTFEDCHLYGPAVLVINYDAGVTVEDPTFHITDGVVQNNLWEQGRFGGSAIFALSGTIPLKRCRFVRCHFHSIGSSRRRSSSQRFIRSGKGRSTCSRSPLRNHSGLLSRRGLGRLTASKEGRTSVLAVQNVCRSVN
jgi:hypothetical protein